MSELNQFSKSKKALNDFYKRRCGTWYHDINEVSCEDIDKEISDLINCFSEIISIVSYHSCSSHDSFSENLKEISSRAEKATKIYDKYFENLEILKDL